MDEGARMKKEPKALHLYMTVDGDVVSAHDPEDAWKVWKEHVDIRVSVERLNREHGRPVQFDDGERIRYRDYEPGTSARYRIRRRTAANVARDHGRGWFAAGTTE